MDANSNPSINLLPLNTVISTATTTRSTLPFTVKSTPDYDYPLILDGQEFSGPYGIRRSCTEKSPIGSSQRPMPSLDDDQWRRFRGNSYDEYSTVMNIQRGRHQVMPPHQCIYAYVYGWLGRDTYVYIQGRELWM